MFMQKFVHTGDDHNEPAAQAAESALAEPLDTLQARLTKRSYLLGEQFTAADLICVSVLVMMPMLGFDFESRPNVDKWFKACTARPAYDRSRGTV